MSQRLVFALSAALLLVAALATVLLAPRLLPGLKPAAVPAERVLPPLDGVDAWIGAAPLTADSLRGRPAAMLLWSESDPRSPAALQVAEAWHRAYAPLGARVVAVHEPGFEFGADSAVAARFVRRLGLTLPVAHDGACAVEGALGGPAGGPRLLVADESGRVEIDTVADMTAGDRALRRMLHRLRPGADLPPAFDVALPVGVRIVELGAGRVREGPLRALPAGHDHVFTAEFRYQEGGRAWTPQPVGGWGTRIEGLAATRGGPANFVAIRYSAGRAGVVVTPPEGGSARLWILRDDRWPRPDERGEDAEADGRGAVSVRVTEPGLYWIDRGEGERVIKLSPESPGVTVHAFVFTGAR